MSNGIDNTKYVKKLLKIIYQKQNIIESLKREKKEKPIVDSAESTDVNSSITHQRIFQDISSNTLQVKMLMEQMQFMEEKINQLNAGLSEEIEQNNICEDNIQKLRQSEGILGNRVQHLNQQLEIQKQINLQLSQKLKINEQTCAKLKEENQFLCKKIKLKIDEENKFQIIVRALSQYQKMEKQIGQVIDNMHSQYCQKQISKTVKRVNDMKIAQRTQDLHQKLVKVELFIKKNNRLQDDSQVLNQTLQGISIIMKSFEENLDGGGCVTNRLKQGSTNRETTLQISSRKQNAISELRSSINDIKLKNEQKQNMERVCLRDYFPV